MFYFLDYFLRHPFKPSLSNHSHSNLAISNPSLEVNSASLCSIEPYSYSVPSPHRIFKNSSSGIESQVGGLSWNF
jgi:hypothetical protein